MADFIKINISSIIMVVLFIVGLLLLYRNGKKEFVRKIILSLVIQAEKALGSGTGELKYAMVIEELYFTLPSILRLLITKKELDKMISNSVEYLKEYLKDGKNLLGYEDEYIIRYEDECIDISKIE